MTEIGIFQGDAPPFIVFAISLAASSYIMPQLVKFIFDTRHSRRGIRRGNFGSMEKVFFRTGLLLMGALMVLPLLCIVRIVGTWNGRVLIALDAAILTITYLLMFTNPAVLWLNKVPEVQDRELPRGEGPSSAA